MLSSAVLLTRRTVPMRYASVNRVLPMETPGARLRAYMEARYLELGLGRRHGFVVDLAKRSGVKRATLNGWFQRSSAPRLDALQAVAEILQVTRAELVAVFDGREVIELDRARAMVREEVARYATEGLPQPEPTGAGSGTPPPRESGAAA
jgi:transcriptional regulator with XRE-family HTH domain